MNSRREYISTAKFQQGENYRNPDNLRSRQSLYEYKRPQRDIQGFVAERVSGTPARILDVGCGNGSYVLRLREAFPEAEVVGIDKSAGVLDELAEPTVVADVVDLPFETGSADVVLAMHMLYHVPDIEKALDELVRVLSPGGVLFVSTIAADDKREYADLIVEAGREALGVDIDNPLGPALDNFTLERAEEFLSARFESVEVHHLDGVVELPEPDPLLAFHRSMSSFTELVEADFERVMDRIATRLETHFQTHDLFTITSHPGILECRSPSA
ncbi:class I SAM-dependent methyltransferase [Glycomyces salinus]|uniref:class I SAM-dependent methyltransferase n=1 Tax=Glycomyces salinus TaxID=980294 RepID=UPI0018EAC453|nr:class I SAM-dependent methyltransferase [Glycomyces salinus]